MPIATPDGTPSLDVLPATRSRAARPPLLAAALWLLVLAAWAAGLLLEPSRGPDASIRRYLAELEAGRVEAALAMLTPDAEARWRDFVVFQRANRYEVVGVAVATTSLLDALGGAGFWRPSQATLVVDVIEPSAVRWRGSTLVPLRWEHGRWRLERPPFAPE